MRHINRSLGAVSVVLAAAAPAFAEDPTAATVVATVNGTEITLGHMIAAREMLPEQYLQLPDDVLYSGILDQLVQQVALAAEAEKDLDERSRLDMENQRRMYLSNVVLEGAAEEAATEEKIQALYDETVAKAPAPVEYSAQHILVDKEEDAKAIIEELKGGADFAAIAKERSTDTGSGAAGGDLGWFQASMMVEPFAKAVEALEKGALTDAPVQSQFGWHVIRLNDRREMARPALEEKREELVAELQKLAIEARIKEVTDAAEVVRPETAIDPAILKQTELLD
jgi:peptidyl-prolyl cis-trans isomerase C